MREITHIVLHCTGASQKQTVASIQKFWRDVRGWQNPGYHFLIEADGTEHNLQPIEIPSNGVGGFNAKSIHVCYIGGVDNKNNPIDNRTPEQICTMMNRVRVLKEQFPNAIVLGHRDFPNVRKACPSFDVKTWLETANVL